MKKSFRILNLIALSLVVLVLIGISSLSAFEVERNRLGEELGSSEASLQGVIEVWNIDTFSGGSISKTDYLNSIARRFEANNKGLYICVKNVTIDELSLSIQSGKKPSVVSFGYGVGDIVKPILSVIDFNCNDVKEEVLNSAKVEDKLFAVGYAMGGYAFFSTSEKLLKASKENTISLSESFETCGYNVELKKRTKHIYGLCYGKSDYISPADCINGRGLGEVYVSTDEYNAYVDFISLNMSTILLGTQRDLVKLRGKLDRGMIEDLILEPVKPYNDLIQYAGIVSGQDELYNKYAKLFVEFLMCESSQKELGGSGMFSTTINNLYQDIDFKRLEEAAWATTNIPNVF